MKNTVHCGKLF